MPGPVTTRAPSVKFTARISSTNIKKVQGEMEHLKQDIPIQVVKQTEIELERLLAYAKSITPVDTSRLQKSGRIEKSGTGGDVINFTVIFGDIEVDGRFVDYAELVHDTHPSMGGFLEKAQAAYMPSISEKVSKGVEVTIR